MRPTEACGWSMPEPHSNVCALGRCPGHAHAEPAARFSEPGACGILSCTVQQLAKMQASGVFVGVFIGCNSAAGVNGFEKGYPAS